MTEDLEIRQQNRGVKRERFPESRQLLAKGVLGMLLICLTAAAEVPNSRKPVSEAEMKRWLENMVWYHNFSIEEVRAATGLNSEEITRALKSYQLTPERKPKRRPGAPLLVLPYPGGRHPRTGFLDGAIDPQRETKLSVFTPWDESSYVVADVPEAIWSNLGLTYLAHTHVPTIWTAKNIQLPPLEWELLSNGDYKMERTLPNGIRFGTLARPTTQALLMKMWLHNGTKEVLKDLRVQNCFMLKGTQGFEEQTDRNKRLQTPFATCHSEDGKRWVIAAWQPCHRAWANPPVPCIHSDPKFPNISPGESKTIYGWLSFYEGGEIEGELERIQSEWAKQMSF